MKKLLPLILFLSLFVNTKAQYVDIPDANFRAYLKNNFSACFNVSDQMDTTCTSLKFARNIFINNSSISNLDGIQYLKEMTDLNCSDNPLGNLPALPNSLFFLNCSNTGINSLPKLPDSLFQLNCKNNNIYCLPDLPLTLNSLECDTSKIHCIPNLTNAETNSSNALAILPLCYLGNNINNCSVITPKLHGKVFYDNNNNGTRDANEPYKKGFLLRLTKSNSETYATLTKANGFYELLIDSLGSYQLSFDQVPNYFTAIPGSQNFNFANNSDVFEQDIALQAIASVDSISFTSFAWHVCGTEYPQGVLMPKSYNSGQIQLSYENAGTTMMAPTIAVKYDSSLIIIDSVTNAATQVNDTSIILDEINLVPGEHKGFNIYFKIKPGKPDCMFNNDSLTFSVLGTVNTFVSRPYIISIQSIGILPVKLISFTAFKVLNNSTKFYWNTTAEVNTKYFVIEESNDGILFNDIESINAKKQLNNNYSYEISKLNSASVMYYRLKIIDDDGRYSYSSIVKIQQQKNNVGLVVINPVKNNLTINVTDIKLVNTEAVLADNTGQVIKKIILQQGLQNTYINNLGRGVYFLGTKQGNVKVVVL